MDKPTQYLVELALDTHFDGLGTEAIHQCKRRIIDTFACALGSFDHELSALARNLASQYRGATSAGIWGSTARTTPEMAAFTNGVMLRVGESSDTFIGGGGGGHPSDMIGGLVAAAEFSHATGKELIASVVLAYDVYCHLMDVARLGAKGWDQVVHVALGTAVGVGKLLRLSPGQLAHAISLAITPNMALRQTRHGELSNWKACAGANAAKNALFAAVMAKQGFEGPAEVFEGKQGLWSVAGRFDWPPLEQVRAQRMVGLTSIKSLPVCYHTQAGAMAALELRHRIDLTRCQSIHIETYGTAVEMAGGDPGQWAPRTQESADHSLPFVVATALVHGKLDPGLFAVERLDDPEVLGIVRKITVNADPKLDALWPETAPARVTVRCDDRTEVSEVLYPLGHIRNPMADAGIDSKFKQSFEGGTDAARTERALGALWHLEDAIDLHAEVLTTLQLARQ